MRLQFSLRTLLVVVLCAAFFFAGMAVQRQRDRPTYERPGKMLPNSIYIETMVMPDGTRWTRGIDTETPEVK